MFIGIVLLLKTLFRISSKRINYQLFQIFKEQRIKNFSKLNTLYSQVMLLPDKEYLFLRSKVVELSRIELLTSCVQGRRSPS